MAAVSRLDGQFAAEDIGRALAQLHAVDSLTLRLFPASNEDGSLLAQCPLTCDSILRNAAIIPDGTGTVYQLGMLSQWVEDKGTSPLTREVLPHRNVFVVSSLTDVLDVFFRVCRERRSQMLTMKFNQHVQAAGYSGERSYEELNAASDGLQNYLAEARTELANWQQYVADLEHVAADLNSRAAQCRRRRDQVITRTLLDRIYLDEAQEQEKRDQAVTFMRALIAPLSIR